MKDHKLQYEATLNFRCTKFLHPSVERDLSHTHTLISNSMPSHSSASACSRTTCRKKTEGSFLVPNVCFFFVFFYQVLEPKIIPQTHTHTKLTPPAKCLQKSTSAARREWTGQNECGWHFVVVVWMIHECFSAVCRQAVCRACDLGLRLACVHSVDVSLSKVLHHYLLQRQPLMGYGACDVARSCCGHF